MKKLFLLTIALLCMGATSFAQDNKHSIGGHLIYGNYAEFGLGVEYQYTATSLIRIAPSLDLFFPSGYTVVNLNGNVHFTFPVTEQITAYPLAGLTLYKASGVNGQFGVNLGGGADYKINDQLKVKTEAKFQLVNNSNQFVISAGVAYTF